jgi:hypothetical protein
MQACLLPLRVLEAGLMVSTAPAPPSASPGKHLAAKPPSAPQMVSTPAMTMHTPCVADLPMHVVVEVVLSSLQSLWNIPKYLHNHCMPLERDAECCQDSFRETRSMSRLSTTAACLLKIVAL